jgi:hypothetical protein
MYAVDRQRLAERLRLYRLTDAAAEREGPAFARWDVSELRHGKREGRKEKTVCQLRC